MARSTPTTAASLAKVAQAKRAADQKTKTAEDRKRRRATKKVTDEWRDAHFVSMVDRAHRVALEAAEEGKANCEVTFDARGEMEMAALGIVAAEVARELKGEGFDVKLQMRDDTRHRDLGDGYVVSDGPTQKWATLTIRWEPVQD